MALDLDTFSTRFGALLERFGRPRKAVIAFSGGRDSTVLLHLLSRLAPVLRLDVVAAHVNHGLEARADDWQTHCERIAATCGVACHVLRVEVAAQGGAGLEANARAARYRALAELLGPADWLLTAHHRDDQAETVLLNLMRGSGTAGLRGAAVSRPVAAGRLLRPLLDVGAADIAAYALDQRLDWIEDPSNEDTRRDRNFLRREVLPLLGKRWPAASRQLARSAALAAQAAELLDALAEQDLATSGSAERLALAALAALGEARLANLLRYACRTLELPPPPSRQLDALRNELLPARADGAPRVRWPGAEARRYRESLYLLPAAGPPHAPPAALLTPGRPVELGAQAGSLALETCAAGGIAATASRAGLVVRYRQGGELLRPAGRDGRRKLKHLMQEAGVVPWMRSRVPLLYAGESLVAVADLWIAHEHYEPGGHAVRWHGKPALY